MSESRSSQQLGMSAIRRHTEKKERILRSQLPLAILADEEQLIKRVKCLIDPHTEVETFTLDGEPLISFYPTEISDEKTGDGCSIRIEQKYKLHKKKS